MILNDNEVMRECHLASSPCTRYFGVLNVLLSDYSRRESPRASYLTYVSCIAGVPWFFIRLERDGRTPVLNSRDKVLTRGNIAVD